MISNRLRPVVARLRGGTDAPLGPARAEELLTRAYRELLGRDPDPAGRAHHLPRIMNAEGLLDVLVDLARSPEYRGTEQSRLVDLRRERPAAYGFDHGPDGSLVTTVTCDDETLVEFEQRIISEGYYEEPNIWPDEADRDKRLLAELITRFAPRRCLELGCGAGATLALVAHSGASVQGVEVSRRARSAAPAEIRDRIVLGDLLEVELEAPVDVICGFDIFEHLSPRTLGLWLERIGELLTPDGVLVANIPAYGLDPHFGQIGPPALAGWPADQGEPARYRTFPVDERGWPELGHLIWANWAWWTDTFAAAGLTRQEPVERRIAEVFGPVFGEYSVPRRAMFVFAPGRIDTAAIVERLSAPPEA